MLEYNECYYKQYTMIHPIKRQKPLNIPLEISNIYTFSCKLFLRFYLSDVICPFSPRPVCYINLILNKVALKITLNYFNQDSPSKL